MNHGAAGPVQLERDEIARRLCSVRERIEAAGGDLSRVQVLAVTKTVPASVCEVALQAGIRDFGENYASELIDKAKALSAFDRDSLRWHFIGDLQRNKIGRLAPHVALWESVDRKQEGMAIARVTPGAPVFVEVRSVEATTPGGVAAKEAPALVDDLRGLGLEVRGLMTIGPQNDPRRARASFRSTRELADRLGLLEVSMGMTDDLEIAVEEGSTMVRVGRALFGPRPAAR